MCTLILGWIWINPASLQAQEKGTVAVIFYWKAKPGKLPEYNRYIREVAAPIDAEAQRKGAFISVTTFVSQKEDGTWTHMRVFVCKDRAQLDQLAQALDAAGASIITISADKADANIGAAFFRPQSRETAVKAADSQRPWYAVMRRCGQINFNERDPLTMDVNEWADYWASLKVNAVLINGGGIVTFYPTQVPYHHRSQILGSRDLFGEMAAALTKRNLHVVARMDCNYAYEEALKAHPEWFERNRDGTPRPHNESTWLFRTCMFSPYFTEQMPAIYREINGRYPVAAFFTNGWPSTGALSVCYCKSCVKVYEKKVGGVPPEETDAANPLYRKYCEVFMDRVLEVWRLWDSVAKEKRPDSLYVGNLGGSIRTVKNVKKLSDVAGWFNADHQGRAGDTVIWDCAQQGRVAQSVMKGRTISNVTGAYINSRRT